MLTLVSPFSSIRCVHVHLWSWNWELLWSHSWNILWPQDSGECIGTMFYTMDVLTDYPSLCIFCSLKRSSIGQHRGSFVSLNSLTCIKEFHALKCHLNEQLGTQQLCWIIYYGCLLDLWSLWKAFGLLFIAQIYRESILAQFYWRHVMWLYIKMESRAVFLLSLLPEPGQK